MSEKNFNNTHQRISLNTNKYDTNYDRKQARIELRSLKDALPLKVTSYSHTPEKVPEDIELKRVAAYCVADRINLKNLNRHISEDIHIPKSSMYFRECLYTPMILNNQSEEHVDVFYFDYGVIICWGLQENSEAKIIKEVQPFLESRYDISNYEIENFSYGIVSENPKVINDVIYLNDEYFFNKMVISNAIAQSVKLDYFENIVEMMIETTKGIPEYIEKTGVVDKKRKDVLKLIGRLHRLKFNLNLLSSVLDEPEILWHHPEHQSLFQSFNHYLEIKPRANMLNMRCDVIQGILDILRENIASEKNEWLLKIIIAVSVAILLVGIVMLLRQR